MRQKRALIYGAVVLSLCNVLKNSDLSVSDEILQDDLKNELSNVYVKKYKDSRSKDEDINKMMGWYKEIITHHEEDILLFDDELVYSMRVVEHKPAADKPNDIDKFSKFVDNLKFRKELFAKGGITKRIWALKTEHLSKTIEPYENHLREQLKTNFNKLRPQHSKSVIEKWNESSEQLLNELLEPVDDGSKEKTQRLFNYIKEHPDNRKFSSCFKKYKAVRQWKTAVQEAPTTLYDNACDRKVKELRIEYEGMKRTISKHRDTFSKIFLEGTGKFLKKLEKAFEKKKITSLKKIISSIRRKGFLSKGAKIAEETAEEVEKSFPELKKR